MSFGQNLQFLRKMGNSMTQEALADRMGVSRQTVSKWELDSAYPEMDKLIELCALFSCTMDQLIREDMKMGSDSYSPIVLTDVPALRYIRYAVISREPEDDAINHVLGWAKDLKISQPEIIGWDFPCLSQEQINVYNMHGYAAALLLPQGLELPEGKAEVICQKPQSYLKITITDPMRSPFTLIPNAYQLIKAHMRINAVKALYDDPSVLPCFEKTYEKEGVTYMDVLIAVKN